MTDLSMTALERAARAAWERYRGEGTWLAERRGSRAMLMAEMAAALRALREPDEAMIKRWADEWGDHADVCADSWGGTIDSILAGQPDGEIFSLRAALERIKATLDGPLEDDMACDEIRRIVIAALNQPAG